MEKEYVEKRIENSAAYITAAQIEILFGNMPGNCVSRDTRRKFNTFLESMQRDIGCIKCDEINGCYIVESGYNFK